MGNTIDRLTGKANSDRLLEGTYYSPAKSVLSLDRPLVERPTADHLAAIHRNEEHIFYSKATKVAKSVASTNAQIDLRSHSGRYNPYSDAVASSLRTCSDDSTTAINRKRKLDAISIDGKKTKAADIAHLVPLSSLCASLYGDMVRAMAGMQADETHDDDEDVKHTRSMALVHGVLEPNSTTGAMRRVRNSGVKHNAANMARVSAQNTYLDAWPAFLMLPTKTLVETLEYTGGEYDVLLIGADEDVYQACRINGAYREASFDELKSAVSTLQSFVKAAAWSLVNNPKSDELIEQLSPRERGFLTASKEAVLGEGVKVPKLAVDRRGMRGIKIATVTLSMDDPDKHHSCDPFALFIKAVSVVTSMQNQKLLPGCPIHECEVCLDEGHLQCHCDYFDPDDSVPSEISFIMTPPEPKRRRVDNS